MPETTAKSNVLDVAVFNRWLGEVRRIEQERADIKAAYKDDLADLNDRKKGIMEAAKGAGIHLPTFKAVLKLETAARKLSEISATIDIENRPMAEIMAEQAKLFAELPFGDYLSRAAGEIMAREDAAYQAHASANESAVDSLTDEDADDGLDEFEGEDPRPRFLKDKGETVSGEAALERLAEGIKPLEAA